MMVTLVLEGPEQVKVSGEPREVLRKADEVLVAWKVMEHGKEKG